MTHKIIPVPAFDYFVFGATGDLAQRKLLPALYYRFIDGQIPQSARVIGCSRSKLDTPGYRQLAANAIRDQVKPDYLDAKLLEDFLSIISYQKIDVSDPESWCSFASVIEQTDQTNRVIVFYLSVAPSLFMPIINGLKQHNLHNNARLVVEKPLGLDLESAKNLNTILLDAFEEDRIYRIDHYLGKETVQNLMALRFANSLFEPLWNSRYIANVQITAAESIGMGGREEYYDKSGAMRDMVQNHLLQLLCLSAMEPPISYDANGIRDEKLKVLRSLQPYSGSDVGRNTVRGQYLSNDRHLSYQQEAKNPNSTTESYVAINVGINNWRWSGTPFYLRTGKRLRTNMTEISFEFRHVPHSIFGGLDTPTKPNAMVIRLQPDERIDLEIMTKEPGPGGMRLRQSILDATFDSKTNQSFRMPRAYERLLLDVVRGDQTLFMRGDEVEAAWAWVDPIIEAWQASGEAPETYEALSQGPAGAFELIAQAGHRWRTIQ
ncbi:MAG: glucose-6-phosphate dehydrogenase [Gammaproteobacteria bacterium]|nr:glucose-6-phosphate dehydrogenase [Gammaproteobacteria bacterium]